MVQMIDSYFKENKFYMFHHFHSKLNKKKFIGSFEEKKFEKFIKKRNHSKDFFNVMTFDDSLNSQFLIAYKLLNKYNLKGIFFLNTFQFDKEKNFNLNELIKLFVNKKFTSIGAFYKKFFSLTEIKKLNINKINYKKEKKNYPFYTMDDIKYRHIRDNFHKNFKIEILKLFVKSNFNVKKNIKELYLSKQQIKIISKKHHIGLHSHSHLNNCEKLDYITQYRDFLKNKKILEKIINKKIVLASAPRGNFNHNTIKALTQLKIKNLFLNRQLKTKNNYNKINLVNRTNSKSIQI